MARRLPDDIYIQTHNLHPDHPAIVCIDPVETELLPDDVAMMSVGVHPWNAAKADAAVFARMSAMLGDPRVVAIGEIGLDRARGPELDVQEPVFERQLAMARERDLPVVLHAVRADDMILRYRRTHPDGQWIIHSYRGKPASARPLLDAGIDLSFGPRYNPATLAATPPGRRYRDTD